MQGMTHKLSVRLLLPCAMCMLASGTMQAQQKDFTIDSLGGNRYIISSMELDPAGKTVAIGTMGGPILFWDVATREVTRKVDVSGYKPGMRLAWSGDGKYLLLQPMFFVVWNPNKDKRGDIEVLDVASGEVVFRKANQHTACLGADNSTVITVGPSRVAVFNIASGNEERNFSREGLGYAAAASPDGKQIAIAHDPTKEELLRIPTVRNDKKALKAALKYRDLVTIYDFGTLEEIATSSDVLDIVLEMKYSNSGAYIYAYNIPHTKMQAPRTGGRQGYINKIVSAGAEVTRAIFSTNAYGADFKENATGDILGVTSMEYKYTIVPQVILCDVQSARPLNSFNVRARLFETFVSDRTGFAFLPDNKTVILGYGPYLAVWHMEK